MATETSNVSEQLRIVIVNGYRNWRQCGMAEPRMHDALDDGALIVAEGFPLVFKLKGKVTALCYENYELPDGARLRRGGWYAPTGSSESVFTEAFKRGSITLSLSEILELAYMRDAAMCFKSTEYTIENLIERTAQYAVKHPTRLPENVGRSGLTREEYLKQNGQTNWDQG